MIWIKRVNLYRGFLFAIHFKYIQIITGMEKCNDVGYKLFAIPNHVSINEAIVANEKITNTVTSCSMFCWKGESSSLYYKQSENMCYCNSNVDIRLNVDNQTEDTSSDVVYGYINSTYEVVNYDSYNKFNIQPVKENCYALYLQGYRTNGVYTIRLSNGTNIDVWCDQQGGGWTVFQHREDGSVNFDRSWTEYVNGFGSITGEYWLGLEAIYLLAEKPSALRIDMETFGDVSPASAYAEYEEFTLQPATDKYRISFGNYTGDCGDSMKVHNHMQFSTPDSDNDDSHDHCGAFFSAGWWFYRCHEANLNGQYLSGKIASEFSAQGMSWYQCWTFDYSLKLCSMKVKGTLTP